MSCLVLHLFAKQICILILLKSTIYNEIACHYNGKISKEDKVVTKTWRVEKLCISLLKGWSRASLDWLIRCSWYDWQASW